MCMKTLKFGASRLPVLTTSILVTMLMFSAASRAQLPDEILQVAGDQQAVMLFNSSTTSDAECVATYGEEIQAEFEIKRSAAHRLERWFQGDQSQEIQHLVCVLKPREVRL